MMNSDANPLARLSQCASGVQQAVAKHVRIPCFARDNALSQKNTVVGGPKLLKRPSVFYGRRGAPFAAIIPGDTVVEQVLTTGVTNFLSLYNSALIIRLVLTWFPSPPAVIEGPLSTICDPYLNLFRGLIPPLGGTLDFSPILAFVVLNVFTSSAAALPAELPTSSQNATPASTKTRSPFSFIECSPVQAVMQRFRHNQRQNNSC